MVQRQDIFHGEFRLCFLWIRKVQSQGSALAPRERGQKQPPVLPARLLVWEVPGAPQALLSSPSSSSLCLLPCSMTDASQLRVPLKHSLGSGLEDEHKAKYARVAVCPLKDHPKF